MHNTSCAEKRNAIYKIYTQRCFTYVHTVIWNIAPSLKNPEKFPSLIIYAREEYVNRASSQAMNWKVQFKGMHLAPRRRKDN